MSRYSLLSRLLVLLALLGQIFAPATVQAQDTQSSVDALIAAMPPEQRVGQLFMVSIPGTDVGPDSAAARLVRDLRVGGVLLRPSNENFVSADDTITQVISLTNGLQTLAAAGSSAAGGSGPFIPLFIAGELE